MIGPLTALKSLRAKHSIHSCLHWLLLAALLALPAERAGAVADPGGPIIPCDTPEPCPPLGEPGEAPEGVEPGMSSDRPVLFLEGAAIERITDLTLPGAVFDWSFVRTYSSGLIRDDTGAEVDSPLGVRWISSARGPYLVEVGSNIDIVVSASHKRVFEWNGSAYTAPVDYNASLTLAVQQDLKDYDRDSNTSETFNVYKLTETDRGNVYVFCGFDAPGIAEGYRGRLVERTTRPYVAQFKDGALFWYNTSGYVTKILPADPQDTDYTIDFTYYTSGESGRLQKVEIKRSTTVIAKAEYTYYGNVSANTALGSTGDLIQVKVSQKTSADTGSAFSIIRYTQYRYFVDGGSDPGEEHQLKMVLDPDAIERITSAGNANVDTPEEILAQSDSYVVASSNAISKYASREFTYYVNHSDVGGFNNTVTTNSSYTTAWGSETLSGTSMSAKYGLGASADEVDESIHLFRISDTNFRDAGMVKTETINAQCGSCSGSASGGVERQYYYIRSHGWQTVGSDKPDAIGHIIVEDTVDSSDVAQYRRVYGTDFNGVAIRITHLTAPASPSGSNTWCWSSIQNDQWRTTERRLPSTHKNTVTSASTLKQFLNPYDPGTDSFANDTATVSSSAGLVYYGEYNGAGYPTGTLVRQGAGTGSRYYVEAIDWGGGSDDEPVFVKLATHRFPAKTTNRTDSSRETTTYEYDFWNSADTQLKKITATLPTIDSGQNGSGTGTTTEEYYDRVSRLRWTKDGEGYVNYYSYHPTLGDQSFMGTDVNPSSAPSGANSGTRWVLWDDDGDGDTTYDSTAKPTRGSSLPTVLVLVETRDFDTQGRLTLRTDARGIGHYVVYQDNREIHFPYCDSSSGAATLPIQVTEVDDAGRTKATYSVDPARTDVDNGVPTGILSGTDQEDYLSWTRHTYDAVNGQLEHIDRYHNIPPTSHMPIEGVLDTHFYRTSYLYDTLGRPAAGIQYVSASKYQVTARIYDTLDRVTQLRRGVATAAPTNYDDLDNASPGTPTNFDGYAITTTTDYDSGGVGDGHVTKVRNYFGTGATEFVEMNYHRTFRGFPRAVERKNNTTVFKPHIIQDVDWLGRGIDRALFTSTIADFSTVVADEDYVATTSSGRNHWTRTLFDDLGRVYQTKRYPGTETANHFEINNFYDRRGLLVGTGDKHATHMEYAHDGAGRQYQERTVLDLEATKYTSGKFNYRSPLPDPHWKAGTSALDTTNVQSGYMSGGDDNLIEFVHTVFDAAGNVLQQHTFEANHNDANGLDLTGNDDYVRRSVYNWYDASDRLQVTAEYGSGDTASGAGTWAYFAVPGRPATAPTSSTDTKLVTQYGYFYGNDPNTGVTENGYNTSVTDPSAIKSKTYFDKLDRRTFVAENFVDFVVPTTGIGGGTNNQNDRVTKWEYNGLHGVTKLIAYNDSSSNPQETNYYYADLQSIPDYHASLLTHTTYPDSSSTPTSGTDLVKLEYNLDGSLKKRTDQRGVVMEYTYNTRRQVELEKATTIPTGVYGGGSETDAVKMIGRTYDDLGRPTHVTSYKSTTVQSSDIINELKLTYGTHGLVTQSEQDHTDAVGSGTSHQTVQYAYDATTSGMTNVYDDELRLETVTYPKTSRVIFNDYGTAEAVSDRLSRLYRIRETNSSGTILAEYSYNGTRRHVITDYQPPDVNLILYFGFSGYYHGLDRFGRIVDHMWDGYNATFDVARVKYGYDFAGNRNWREDVIAANNGYHHDEYYTYDGLHRLKNGQRGNLTGTPYNSVTSRNFEQDWTLDQLGNWGTFKERDTDAGSTWDLDQTRAHNVANEIDTDSTHGDADASITGTPNWADPIQDAAGNMTTLPKPADPVNAFTAKYDAWNRLVEAKSGANTIQTNEYDGLCRRIVRVDTAASDTYDYFYNEGWQLLEERKDGSANPLAQYAWHPYYIDALAVRYYDADTDNNLAENNDGAHYFAHDANFNVTAVVNASGTVLERYQYSPYGSVTFLGAFFAVSMTQSSAIGNHHLYTGRERDPETGLQLNRNRYFAPHLGRWLTRDPIEYEGDDENLYNYTANGPLEFIDPFGEQAACPPAGVWGMRLGVAGGLAVGDGPFIAGEIVAGGLFGYWLATDVVNYFSQSNEEEEDGHRKGARESTRTKHEEGDARRRRDRGREKGDSGRQPPRKRPGGWKGPWPPGFTCFAAGTLVSIPGQDPKPIELLKVGDTVISYDFQTKEWTSSQVEAVHRHHVNEIYILTIDGETITTTAEHPFYVVSKGWTQVKDLVENDALIKLDGDIATISRITKSNLATTVYNISVATHHNYFVGHLGYLVHNKLP